VKRQKNNINQKQKRYYAALWRTSPVIKPNSELLSGNKTRNKKDYFLTILTILKNYRPILRFAYSFPYDRFVHRK